MTRWKGGRPPETKLCNRCGRELNYARDFYQTGRMTERGLVWYATQPCIKCMSKRDRRKPLELRKQRPELTAKQKFLRKEAQRRYQREFKRMNKKLQTDITMKSRVASYREREKRVRLAYDPFERWLEEFLRTHQLDIEEMCDAVGVASRTLRLAKKNGYLSIDVAEKFFLYAESPELLHTLYA